MSQQQNDVSLRADRFKLLVDAVQNYGIFMLDLNGIVQSWNLGASLLKGYAADEVIGKHFSMFYPETAKLSRWPDHELRVASQKGSYEEEGWRVRKDGSMFWAHVFITALHDESGTLIGFGKVTRDATERSKDRDPEHSSNRMRFESPGATIRQNDESEDLDFTGSRMTLSPA